MYTTFSVGLGGKLVCSKGKSVLSESVLTVLTYMGINREGLGRGQENSVYKPSVCYTRVRSNEVLLYGTCYCKVLSGV